MCRLSLTIRVIFFWAITYGQNSLCNPPTISRPEDRAIIVWKPQSPDRLQCAAPLGSFSSPWGNSDHADERIPRVSDGNTLTVRAIAPGDLVQLRIQQPNGKAPMYRKGRVVGFAEHPREPGQLLIGIYGSTYTNQVTPVRASSVVAKSSHILKELSDGEWSKYEDQITLPVGPPEGKMNQFIWLNLTELFGTGPVQQMREQMETESPIFPIGDQRLRRRVEVGDLIVNKTLGGQLVMGLVNHVSDEPEITSGHVIKALKLRDSEYFFSHGPLAYEWEFYGAGLDRNSFILSVDWMRTKRGLPLAEFLAERGIFVEGSLPRAYLDAPKSLPH